MIEPALPMAMPITVRRDGMTMSIEQAMSAYRLIPIAGDPPQAYGLYRALTIRGEWIEGYPEALPWYEIVGVEPIDSRLELCPCCADWPVRIDYGVNESGDTIILTPHCEHCKRKGVYEP